MTKIMLVEDDKSLREIYDVRLRAEGYDIKYAGDGEEALAMAVKEHPDLIVSDVMMPKISGFDMLDILRATPETKNIKVIMMTALSSEDQRARGESLGADRYLVKSQVGIEDVVRTVHEVLGDVPTTPPPAQRPTFTPGVIDPSFVAQTPFVAPAPQPAPATPTMQPVMPVYAAAGTFTQTPAFEAQVVQTVPMQTPVVAPQPVAPVQQAPEPVYEAPQPAFVPQFNTIEYAPEPVFTEQPVVVETPAPVFIEQPIAVETPTPVIVEQPAVFEAQPPVFTEQLAGDFTPAPVMAEEIVTQLPEPTAPFSTPAPASLGNGVMNPAIAQEAQLNQELINNNIFPPQANGPTA